MRILELNHEPKIGTWYTVPCINIPKTELLFPVMGQPHSDPELENYVHHIHLDIRFMTDADLRFFNIDNPENLLNNEKPKLNRPIPALEFSSEYHIIEILKKCVREGLDLRGYRWKNGATLRMHTPNQDLHKIMEDQQEHKTINLKNKCITCPHRGIPLNSVPVTDGVVTCPGHGLQWSMETGKLVRKTGPKGQHIYKEEV